jgi:hypothetical protein
MPILKDSAPVIFPDENQLISKYIDLTRFISLLSKKSLFFCRLDKLEDKFEGTTAKKNYDTRILWYQSRKKLFPSIGELTDEQIKERVEQNYQYEKKVKEFYCVCCWNKANKENMALWKIYSDFGKGIMIKTSVKNLISPLTGASVRLCLSVFVNNI